MVFVPAGEELFRSTDGGRNWTDREVPGNGEVCPILKTAIGALYAGVGASLATPGLRSVALTIFLTFIYGNENKLRMTTGQFVLSGLGDEIDPDVAIQLEVMNGEGLDHLELRGMENTNVLDLSAEQIARTERVLDEYGFKVSAIASPIGKVDVTDPFEPHFERFERALALTDEFDAEYVRIFSYYYPEDDDPEDWRDEILERMARKAERAEANGVTLVHENERDIYGDTPERCRDIIETIDSPNLRALFDPANFVVDGIEVYPTAYDELADYVEYVHVKDARFADDIEIEPAGEGDADVREVIKALDADGYDGFLSLEPHLAHAGQKGGFSGPEAFRTAVRALQDVLSEADISAE